MIMAMHLNESDHERASLLDDVIRLREHILSGAVQRVEKYPAQAGRPHSASMQNLAHYLSPRRIDLSPLHW